MRRTEMFTVSLIDAALSDSGFYVMPPSLGWAESSIENYEIWDYSLESRPFVKMEDVRTSGWINLSIILNSYESAGFKWDEFSVLVGRYGVRLFGNLVDPAAQQCYLELIKTSVPLDERPERGGALLSKELVSRHELISSTGEYENTDDLVLLSFLIDPDMNAQISWSSLPVIYERYGIVDTERLIAAGFSVEKIFEAAVSDVDAHLLVATAD